MWRGRSLYRVPGLMLPGSGPGTPTLTRTTGKTPHLNQHAPA
ncbi:hypothetical protein [Streptosporangium saharense]